MSEKTCEGSCECNCSQGREPLLQEAHTKEHRVARREALIASATAIGAVLLNFLPGSLSRAALARSLETTFKPPKGAKKVGNIKHLPADSALSVTDPRSGNPAVVVRLSEKKFLRAYSAVCTHRGCTVRFDANAKLLSCPCHGSQFDPAHSAQVVTGPALTPLPSLKVKLDPKGNIWLV